MNSKEQSNIIIMNTTAVASEKTTHDAVVVVSLFYEEMAQFCCEYLNGIDESIKIHIVSPKSNLIELCKEILTRGNIEYRLKENRGRDISALLVAARDVIMKHDFVCFIHDKMPTADYLKADVDEWNQLLWNSMLYNQGYVDNILQHFQDNPKEGILFPPEPYGEFKTHWYGDTWYDNLENTLDLAERLGVDKAKVSSHKPCGMGTVFWARTDSLKKLFDYKWTYLDFPDEPVKQDGEINHAIERVIEYVVEDAGYSVKTVMANITAANLLSKAQSDMRYLFSRVSESEKVLDLHQLKNLDSWTKELKDFAQNKSTIYIYGAGVYGKVVLQQLIRYHIQCDGFIVSDGHKQAEKLEEYRIYELCEIQNTDSGIILGVSYEKRKEILDVLTQRGFKNILEGL